MKTKKIIASLLAACTMLGSLSLQGVVTGLADGADNGIMRDSMTAQEYADEMGLGINLGNTMEGYWLDRSKVDSGSSSAPGNTPQDFEKCWGAVVTTQAAITGMKDAGFNTVRIPVYWGNMMEEDGTFTINPQYIGRVKEIVDYCRNAGVYAVINIHHYDEFVIRRFSANDDLEGCSEVFSHLWTQIAEYFKDYSDYLVFEGYNEALGIGPLDKDGNGTSLPEDEAYEWTNTLNQTFVDAVRATGGNNAKRMLIASGYFTNIDNTTNSKFIMPTDTAKDRLMVSVHYVDNGVYWSNQIGNDFWEQYSINQLELLKNAFTSKGIPVFIGESTTSTTYTSDNRTHFASDAKITDGSEIMDFMLRLIKGYDFIPVLWDINDVFYSRTQNRIKSDADAEVIQKLAEELSSGTFVPPETSYIPPMAKDDALGLLYSGKGPVVLSSGIADTSIAGAVQIKYVFDCASDISFNPWAYIDLSATVAGTESKHSQSGQNDMKGQTALEAVLDLKNSIKEGDSYSVSASTNAWGEAPDYVFLIRRIEFLDADGNVLKVVVKEKPEPTEPTNPSNNNNNVNPTTPPTNVPTTAAPKVTTTTTATDNATQAKKDAQNAMKQAKIAKLTAKSKGKKITVTWKKVNKATGYEVQVSSNKKFKKSKILVTKNVKKTKVTIKNKKIKSGKTYYVRVRAYATYKDAKGATKKVTSSWNKQLRKVKVK